MKLNKLQAVNDIVVDSGNDVATSLSLKQEQAAVVPAAQSGGGKQNANAPAAVNYFSLYRYGGEGCFAAAYARQLVRRSRVQSFQRVSHERVFVALAGCQGCPMYSRVPPRRICVLDKVYPAFALWADGRSSNGLQDRYLG